MAVERGYPVTLVHPQHRAAELGLSPGQGKPERFAPVSVNSRTDEEFFRAKGYIRNGEPANVAIDHREFPKILRHPEHHDAVQAATGAEIRDGALVTFAIPAIAEVMPDVIVNNSDEEAQWTERGYGRPGQFDPKALDSALESPKPEAYVPSEWPRWMNGKLESDPSIKPELEPDPSYPRLVGETIVEDPRKPAVPDPFKYPMWVHFEGKPSEASELVNSEIEEQAAWAKWRSKNPEPKLEFEPKPELPASSALESISSSRSRRPQSRPEA
jgi:hypothetical protein